MKNQKRKKMLGTAQVFWQNFGLALIFGGCGITFGAQAETKSASPGAKPYSAQMQDLSRVIAEVIVDVSSDARYNQAKNKSRIEKNAKKLSELAHQLKINDKSADDLSVSFIGELFKDQTQRAYLELKRGHSAYARTLLRSIPGYCLACHSRTGAGPHFESLPINPLIKNLSPMERGEVLAASREYDAALNAYESVIKSSDYAQNKSLDWDRAARTALAIAVRVKNDPARAQTIVDSVLGTSSVPEFVHENAEQWKRSLESWKKEPKKSLDTEAALFAEGERLYVESMKSQKYPADRGADILFLRTSSVFHEFLGKYPQSSRGAEALMYLGTAYQALGDLRIWDLHEFFFEACIQQQPHSGIAQNCYRRLEESIFMGYTGTGGFPIPSEVKSKLKELENLAKGKPIKD